MNKYEVLYIIAGEVAEEERETVFKNVEAIVTENGGNVENVEKWGTKKFAYPIDYKNEGFYVLMNFEANPEVPAEMERRMRISDKIVRCMIIKKNA